MKISKDQLKQIIKEELDDASAHTIATGGETIENPKMPTGFGHYAGKGRYEDWNTAGSGDRARAEDLESIRIAGDIGEKPESQQRYDISDETGVPVLRSDLDDALASLSKDQLNIMIKEELAAVLHEEAPSGAGPKSRRKIDYPLGRDRASMPVDQQDNPSTDASPYSGKTPAEEADMDVAWQGGYGDAPAAPRSKGDKPARSRYGYPKLGSAEERAATFGHKIGKALEVPKAAFDAFGRAMGKGSEPKYNPFDHNAKSAPKVNTALEIDGKVLANKVSRMTTEQKGGHGGDPNMHKIDSEFISKETGGTGGFGDDAQEKTTVVSDKDTFKSRQRSSRGTGKLDSFESDASLVDNTGKRQSATMRGVGDVSYDSYEQTPAGGSRAKASSKNPLGLGKAKGAFGGETLKKGGKKLNIGDKDYLSTLQKVGLPGVPEAGKDNKLIPDLNETFDRWKKLIK